MSKVYSIRTVQQIPATIEKTWAFFSDPANLKNITPGNMDFKTISKPHGDSIYAGQVIEYKIRPFLRIPLYWMTEITHVEDKKFFVDEQRHGPFSMWHHQHHFKETESGVEMTDIIHYELPFWFLGTIAHWLFVKKDLKKIFDHRREQVDALFPGQPNELK